MRTFRDLNVKIISILKTLVPLPVFAPNPLEHIDTVYKGFNPIWTNVSNMSFISVDPLVLLIFLNALGASLPYQTVQPK